jgi:phage tail protein X
MPIRITKIGRQRTVAGLAKALFDTKGSAALQERAEEALLRANPRLAEEGGIKPGSSVIVPEVRDLGAKEAAADGKDESEAAIGLARGRAQALADLGGRSLEAALGGAKRAARELKSEATATALLAVRPDFRARLEAARGEADKEVKRIADAGKELRKVTALALDDLAALGDAVKPEG